MHADPLIDTVRALCKGTLHPVICWLQSLTTHVAALLALVTFPHRFGVAVGLELDCAHVHVPVKMPLLLQLRAQPADICNTGGPSFDRVGMSAAS